MTGHQIGAWPSSRRTHGVSEEHYCFCAPPSDAPVNACAFLPASGEMLQIVDLNANFGNPSAQRGLKAINFSVRDGTLDDIVGPNGSGKTTLLECIAGLH